MERKNLKISVIDNDIYYSEKLAESLSSHGFDTVKIVSDFDVIEKEIFDYCPDIIILDAVLPGNDGLMFMKNIRAHTERFSRTEIIIVSAFYNEQYIKAASSAGAYRYFVKPIAPEIILNAVDEIYKKRSSYYPDDSCIHGKNNLSFLEEPVDICSFTADKTVLNRRRIVKITQLLHDMGIPAHLCGHDYLRDAIVMVMDSHEISGRMTKEIYPEIANKYKKSPQSVERAIRTALDVAWTRGKTELINDIFRFTVNIQKGRPTNSEFVSLIADYLNYECMSAV